MLIRIATWVLLLCAGELLITTFSIATTSLPNTCSTPFEEDNSITQRKEVYGNGKIFDITHRYTTNMPSWESTEGLGQFLWLPASMKNGSLANNSEMKLPTHTGTHVDAPGHVYDHYFDVGFNVDTLDLDVLNGPALFVDVPRDKNILGIETTNAEGVKETIVNTVEYRSPAGEVEPTKKVNVQIVHETKPGDETSGVLPAAAVTNTINSAKNAIKK